MKYVKYESLNTKEKEGIEKAIEAAEHSVSNSGHKIGAAIVCKNGDIFVGATNSRSRAIGSTCAERMAVDQMYFHGNKKPVFAVVLGLHNRLGWTKSTLCTPCGVCLEMYWEMAMELDLEDLKIICPSWNKRKILITKLTELYPRIDPIRRK